MKTGCVCVCCHTWVKPTVVTLVVPVLPAAGSLLQAGTGLSTVTGLLLYVANTHSHRRLAGFGTATPKAPVVHNAVLSWVLVPVERGWGGIITGYPLLYQTIKLPWKLDVAVGPNTDWFLQINVCTVQTVETCSSMLAAKIWISSQRE